MALPEGIEVLPLTEWENAHQNFKTTFKPHASFKLRLPASAQSSAEKYRRTTENFKWLIKHAINAGTQLRAMGSGWSFSEVAVSDGGIVDTKSLRLSFALNNSFVASEFLNAGKQADNLFFAQCGMTILHLNAKLEKERKKSLRASGASNGQTIVGAMATGTHGAAFEAGAVHDMVVGMHIVTGPDRHVWVERKSYPVASEEFIKWLGAEPIRDDDVFNAAVVSFGSFGFIHGVLLEVEPLFLLESYRLGEVPYNDALKKAMNQLDFSAIAPLLPAPPIGVNKRLYHFEVVVNPHRFEQNNPQKGPYLRLRYKVPYRQDYPRIQHNDSGFMYGDDTLGVIQTVLDHAKGLSVHLIPPLVNKLFPLAFKPAPPEIGTIGETFTTSMFRGKAASAAIGVDIKDASRVLDEIIAINDKAPFAGGLGLRYVRGTKATLGFTKFPTTCVLEMDGVEAKISRQFFQKVWERLDALAIPYTLHWGKINFNLTPDKVRWMYGNANVTNWISCRNRLLDKKTLNVFNNDFIKRCGLDKEMNLPA